MVDSIHNRCLECKIKSTAISALNNNELEFLNENCTTGIANQGEIILREGDPARFVVYIRDGFVKQMKKSPDGKEHILSIVKKGSYIGLHNIVTSTRINYISAKALVRTSVCIINTHCFGDLLKRNGEFASRVISCICEDEIFFVGRLLKNQHQQLYGRLADALLYFRNEVYNENPFILSMTRGEIASFVGTSRESVTRALKDFQENGLIIVKKKMITIMDENKLMVLCKKG